jgi:glucokinase
MMSASGTIVQAPNLPMLDGVNLVEALEERLAINVILENDATSAAIGEHWLGASKDVRNSICITLGTGVGGGIILNGEPLRGPDGSAGEVGHICVEPEGIPCGCGSIGCLEQYSSATAIVRHAKELYTEQPEMERSRGHGYSAVDLYRAACGSDIVAVEVFDRMGFYLGIALSGLINLLNPEAIVLAGGLADAWDMFIGSTRGQIEKRAFREPAGRAKLVRAKLGDDAGILGVASVALAAPDKRL